MPRTIDPGSMRRAATDACRLMKTLANPDRLMLLCHLSQGEMNVGGLEEEVGIGQPTLSQQLTVLREEGLVDTRRDGKFIYYRVADQRALAVLDALYGQFCKGRKK